MEETIEPRSAWVRELLAGWKEIDEVTATYRSSSGCKDRGQAWVGLEGVESALCSKNGGFTRFMT